MSKLAIAMVQSQLEWENPRANQINFEKQFSELRKPVDIIILPEMFTTGFTMNAAAVAESMEGESVDWMRTQSKKHHAAITGSLVIRETGKFYNRLLFVKPSGEISTYDKRHLFTLAGEEKVYSPGAEKLIVEYKGWKICPLVCYDLRFPVFSRNVDGYDLLIYVANWPQPRIAAWNALLKARAIENMSYTIGVNRVGTDNNNHCYPGNSQLLDFMGNQVAQALDSEIVVSEINFESQADARKKFGFLADRDDFTVM